MGRKKTAVRQVSVNLTEESNDILIQLMNDMGMTTTEAINYTLTYYMILVKKLAALEKAVEVKHKTRYESM